MVDSEEIPMRHFGVILDVKSWHKLRDHLSSASVTFLVKPQIRFAGEPGEQLTLFLRDPSGNALEFKAFADDRMVFARS
jgi:extradiol dioxygenase family protein